MGKLRTTPDLPFAEARSEKWRSESDSALLKPRWKRRPNSLLTIAAALVYSGLVLLVILGFSARIHKQEQLELRLAFAQVHMSELGTCEKALLDGQDDAQDDVSTTVEQKRLVDGALREVHTNLPEAYFKDLTPKLEAYYAGLDRMVGLVLANQVQEARRLDALAVDQQGESAEAAIGDLAVLLEKDGNRSRILANLISILVVAGTSIAWALASRNAESLRRSAEEESLREEANEASRARFAILVERAADMIAVVSPSLTFQFVSQASSVLIGKEGIALAGQALSEGFTDPGAVSSILAAIEEVRASPGEASRCEVRAVIEGQDKFIEIHVANLTRVIGIGGFVLTCHDCTDQRQAVEQVSLARDQALEAAAAKSQFLANMSHEIRTPMNGVIGMLELILDTPLTQGQTEYLRVAQSSADSLLNVINDILDFSKLEAGKMLLRETPTDLSHLLEDVGEMLAVVADEKGIELLVAVPEPSRCQVLVDPLRIRQVVMNLVNNALKFTHKGDVVLGINIRGETAETLSLEIFVRDSGIGISEDNQRRIFEDFTQADGSITRQYGGTGLGLTISQSLAALMGGEIKCKSTLGEGSTFSLEITVTKAEPFEKLVSHGRKDFGGKRVLIIDDNAVNRQILAGFVQSWGSEADEADSGIAGLKMLESAKLPYDVILLDFQMPGMDGLETAKRIRELGPNSLVLMLSSVDSNRQREFLDDAGIHVRLMKPVRKKELLAAIKGASLTFAKPDAAEKAKATPTYEMLGLNILLVEDNPVNQLVAKKMLERLGCTVTIAEDGLQALVATSQKEFDVVLMDCEMPVMDGYQATHSIRERELGGDKRLTIIALTAHALEGAQEKCLEAGMDLFVTKPLQSNRLLAALKPLRTRTSEDVAA